MAIVPKEILRVGKYWTNAGLLTVTPQRLKHFEQSGNAMIHGRLSIPLPYNHQPEAEPTTSQDLANRVKNNTGFASKYYCLGDSLWCDLDVADKEAESKLTTTIKFVSPKISPVFTDGRGKVWNDVITHIALTPRPRFIDQTPFGTDPNAFYMSDDDGPGVCLSLDNLLSDETTMPQTSFGASQYHSVQHEDHDQKMRHSLDAEKTARQSGDMASFITHAKNSDYHRAMSQYHAHMASHHAANEHAKYDSEHPEPGSQERLQKNTEVAKRSLGHAEKWKDSVVKQGFPDPSQHTLSDDESAPNYENHSESADFHNKMMKYHNDQAAKRSKKSKETDAGESIEHLNHARYHQHMSVHHYDMMMHHHNLASRENAKHVAKLHDLVGNYHEAEAYAKHASERKKDALDHRNNSVAAKSFASRYPKPDHSLSHERDGDDRELDMMTPGANTDSMAHTNEGIRALHNFHNDMAGYHAKELEPSA